MPSNPSSTTSSQTQQPDAEPASPQPLHHDEQNSSQVFSNKEREKEKDDKNSYRVDWEPNDKENPRNWSTSYKSWITFQLGMLAMSASLGSSIISPAEDAITAYTRISSEVAVLPISFYILGFAFGPLLWAPVSEVWGRKWSIEPATFCLGLFSIGTATSTSAASIIITRFFAGVFGSAPVSNVSAALGDMWAPKARGTAVTFYAVAVVGGPTLGPGMQLILETLMQIISLTRRNSDRSRCHGKQAPGMALDGIHPSNLGVHRLCHDHVFPP